MKKQMHRLLSLMLSLILVVGMIPGSLMTAHAMDSSVDFDIRISGTRISDIHGTASGAGWTYNGTGVVPRITLDNYTGSGIFIWGLTESTDFYITVKGNCKIEGDSDLCGIINTNPAASVGSAFQLTLVDNAKLEITSPQGIFNTVDYPSVRIGGDGQIDIQASNYAIYCYGLATQGCANGEVSVSDNIALNANGSINIGWRATGNNVVVHFREPFLRVSSGATVSLKDDSGVVLEGYNENTNIFPELDMPENYIQVVKNDGKELHIFTPKFKEQTPSASGSTQFVTATEGDELTFSFDSNTAPDGYTVEKYLSLTGPGIASAETATKSENGDLEFTRTFDQAGMYTLKEVLRLKKDGESETIASKTNTFYIFVNEKPLVTPTITTQPESVTSATGDSVTLTATAENAERARWYVEKSDGTVTALDGAFAADGTSTQTISKASNAVGNRYFCAFWSVDGKIAKTNSVAVCFVPTVTSNGNVTVAAGNTAFLKVTESGCGHYADANGWYKGGVELTSGDKYYIMGTTLAVQNAAAEDAGTYTYKYVTEHGDEVTANVTLTVNTGSSSATIDTFDITGLDNPVILGTVADTSVSVPTGANYTVESVTWTAGVNGSGVVTGSSGVVSIKLKAKDSYTFKSGDLAGTVEGIYKTVYSVPANATEITVTVDYNNYSSWKIAFPANDTISISTDSLTFKVGTAANGQKVEGAFNCTHSGLADTNLHHTGMKYAVYSGIANNEMPAGLTLNADGTITGTPTTAGVYTVTVRADSVNANGTASNCSGLAVKAIEIIVEDKDAHTHDTEVVSDTATCTTDGVMTLKCGCTVESPAKGHDWEAWGSVLVPTCQQGDYTQYRDCNNGCGEKDSRIIEAMHMSADDWSTDATDHWKVCTYGCGTIVVEKENHTDADSNKKCDVCEYDMTPAQSATEYTITVTGGTASANKAVAGTEITLTVDESAIPAGKVFDKWEVVSGGVTITDGKFTMPANAVEIRATYKDAPVAPTEITDVNATVAEPVVGGTPSTVATTTGTDYTVFVRGWYDEEENTVSVFEAGKTYTLEVGFTPKEGYVLAGSKTLNATINDKEAEYLSLNTINGTVTCFIRYTIPAVVPTEYDITVTGGTASANKAVAGTVITLTVDESAIPAGKVFDKWEVVSGGVTITDGKFTMPANAVEINATYKDAPVSHTCDIKPVAKDEPSCTEGGKEAYYKCEGCGKFYEDALGAKEITDLANWGNLPKLGHTESDWKSDKDNHWKECTVTACGVIIEDSKAAHKDDNKDGKCDVCEYNVGLPTTPDDDKPNDNPQTGDNSNMFLWIALLFVSGLSVVATVFGKKKFSVK